MPEDAYKIEAAWFKFMKSEAQGQMTADRLRRDVVELATHVRSAVVSLARLVERHGDDVDVHRQQLLRHHRDTNERNATLSDTINAITQQINTFREDQSAQVQHLQYTIKDAIQFDSKLESAKVTIEAALRRADAQNTALASLIRQTAADGEEFKSGSNHRNSSCPYIQWS